MLEGPSILRVSVLRIKAFAERLSDAPVPDGEVRGRIVARTSEHAAHNTPYGASKGALDRIVVAAALELADLRVRANAINPGPIDTCWMNDEIRAIGVDGTPAGWLGTPQDTADLVCSCSQSRARGSTVRCSTATAASEPVEEPGMPPALGLRQSRASVAAPTAAESDAFDCSHHDSSGRGRTLLFRSGRITLRDSPDSLWTPIV